MGIVQEVVIKGSDIRVDIVMPYAGRETWLDWFSDGIKEQLRARLRDVGEVEVRLVCEPKWTPRRLSDRARRVIGPREE
ncbi:MAG: hypothetical protein J4F35_04550 [Candidatus Latescibacteria bacterium]|nr:hypothetical protein [Candidatus Latescibacterota bacterium]